MHDKCGSELLKFSAIIIAMFGRIIKFDDCYKMTSIFLYMQTSVNPTRVNPQKFPVKKADILISVTVRECCLKTELQNGLWEPVK